MLSLYRLKLYLLRNDLAAGRYTWPPAVTLAKTNRSIAKNWRIWNRSTSAPEMAQ